jgi:hypothetical protein
MSNRLEKKPLKNVPTRWSAKVITVLKCNLKDELELRIYVDAKISNRRNVLEENTI